MSRGTPARNVRVSDELWGRALARAEEEGTSVSAVIVRALEEWVETKMVNGTNPVCDRYEESYNGTGCETCGHSLPEHYPVFRRSGRTASPSSASSDTRPARVIQP